jgi:uncharacterized membrane protein
MKAWQIAALAGIGFLVYEYMHTQATTAAAATTTRTIAPGSTSTPSNTTAIVNAAGTIVNAFSSFF